MPCFVKFRVKSVLFTFVVIFCFMFTQIYAINNVADCGKRKLPYQSTITHGAATDISRWPWHASIYHKLNNASSYACGGTIVDKNTILTAAHCVFITSESLPADQISVHVGRDHRNTTSGSVQVLEALELLIHPEYRKQNVAHDIAIVKLSSNIEMTDFVQPACLLTEDEAQHHIVGTQGTILGFVKTENDPVYEYLQEANLTVVDGLKCLEDAHRFVSQVLTTNMFCARGQPGVSACSADSGGGMFFERNGTWYVRGIVSFNAMDGSCANSNFTVFTDVNKYLSWIMNFTTLSMVDNGIDSDFLLIRGPHQQWIVEPSSRTYYDTHFMYGKSSAFDCKEGRIYGIENNGTIFSVDHTGEDRKEFIRTEYSISHLAVDWIGRRLFWYNKPKKTIEVASLDDPSSRTVLFSTKRSISNMVVDPHRGKLYWVEAYNRDFIKWSNLDGTNRRTLLGFRRNLIGSSITVLMHTGELCYSKNKLPKICCIDAYRKKHRRIVTTTGYVFGMAATDSLFYWMHSNRFFLGTPSIESVNMKGERQPPIAIPVDFGVFRLKKKIYRKYSRLSITLVTGNCPNPSAINNGDSSENTIYLSNPDAPGGKNGTTLSNAS